MNKIIKNLNVIKENIKIAADEADRDIYPGIMEYENEQERIENGIPLHKEVVDWFSSVSKSMNIDSVKLL